MMMNRIGYIIALISLSLSPIIGQNDFSELSPMAQSVSSANNLFSKDLYSVLRNSLPNDGNLIFSPLSLSTVVAMVYAGSKGKTSSELRSVFKFPESNEETFSGYKALIEHIQKTDGKVTLEMANRVYAYNKFSLNQTYTKIIQDNFKASVEQLDFSKSVEAAATINNWVEQSTHNKIKDLIKPDSLTPLTRLVLVNAIYFKGAWNKKFNPELTSKEKFYNSPTESVLVDMMKMDSDFLYADVPELDAQAISLPYDGMKLSMVILLPNAKDGLSNLESKLKNFDLSQLKLRTRRVSLQMPKFKLESTIPLVEPLKKLGATSMFGIDADFSGIPQDTKDSLYVSEVLQKAFIEVNEEGSEAAASTGLQISLKSAIISRSVDFFADHPFITYIYDSSSDSTFFMATLQNPNGSGAEFAPHNHELDHSLHSRQQNGASNNIFNSIFISIIMSFMHIFRAFI